MSESGGDSAAADTALAVENLKLQEPPSQTDKTDTKTKIDILLKATGNAPIMKKKRWAIDAEKPVAWIQEFLAKYIKLDNNEKIFVYVNQTFAPAPDQLVRNLYDCFGADGRLVLHYCTTHAWG